MRTSAVCIQAPVCKKRKYIEDENHLIYKKTFNKTPYTQVDDEYTLEEMEDFDDTSSLYSENVSQSSPILSSTHIYIKSIVDKLTQSVQKYMPILFKENKDTCPQPIKKQNSQMTKSNNISKVKAKKKLFSTNQNFKPYHIGSKMTIEQDLFSPIKINSIYRFCKDENANKKNVDTIKALKSNSKLVSDIVNDYLNKRNKKLFRSKTCANYVQHSSVTSKDMDKFIWLVEEDPMISLFIKRDICHRYADKYLLAMVFAYFIRANLDHEDYNRENFFAALYLAHDMEEEEEELKYEVFPFCLGISWKKSYSYLLSLRDDIFWAIQCRAVVSKKCCDQVMSLIPDHWLWTRDRPEYHSYINKSNSTSKSCPRGPYSSPLWCRLCVERECLDASNPMLIYSSPSSLSTDYSDEEMLTQSQKENEEVKDSGFESFLCPQMDEDEENQDPQLLSGKESSAMLDGVKEIQTHNILKENDILEDKENQTPISLMDKQKAKKNHSRINLKNRQNHKAMITIKQNQTNRMMNNRDPSNIILKENHVHSIVGLENNSLKMDNHKILLENKENINPNLLPKWIS